MKENQASIYLNVKDHSVSKEKFQLLYNEELDLLETHPQPAEDDLDHYYESEDYISHTNTKRNTFEKVYHMIRWVSLKRKVRLINSSHTSEKKLLDVGCGTGDFLSVAIKNGWQGVGLEPNVQARTLANQKTNNAVHESEFFFKLKPHSFDVITLWHVLEHIPNRDTYIKQLSHLLKPEGHLIIAVPNYKAYDARHYKNFWAAYDVPRHLWHFSKTSISKLFSTQGLRVIKTKPMWFDAFYVSLLSEKYKTGKMKIVNAFFIGLLSNLKGLLSKEYSSHIYVLKRSKNPN